MSKIKQDIERQLAEYLRYTRNARWMVIALTLASLLLIPGQPVPAILLIIGVATLFNVASMTADYLNKPFFNNRRLILLIDIFSAVILVVVTGGQNSLYTPVLLFMIISSAYWYGAAVAAAVTAAEAVLEVAGSEIFASSTLPGWNFVLRFGLFATVGLYLAWLTQSERGQHVRLMTASAETELQRQQLLALLNTMSDAVLVADPEGRVLLTNSAAGMFVDQAKIIQGTYIEGLFKFIDSTGTTVKLKLKSIDQKIERRDLKFTITDGSQISAMLTVTPYTVGSKEQGYILIIRDITREHTIEQERLEFIAVAQHELRTPLTVAEGGISMALSPEFKPTNPAAIEMLQMSFRSLRQLSNIVTDLTTLAQAQSGDLNPDVESIDIATIFQDLVKENSVEAARKNIKLKLTIPEGLKPIISSRYLVYEIMSNFMSNALKFTEEGTIELIATPRGERGVALSVRDTGRGISSGDQKKLFTNFFQSEDWRTRDHGGTGLGLFISRKLAKRLTAEVYAQSKLGKGSTFTLELPPYSQHENDQTKVAKAETQDFFKYL